MAFFIAESVTCSYDLEQDRLSLRFTGTNQEQLTGLLTRQFLKRLLMQLPTWLIQQHPDDDSQVTEQQRIISSFQHQHSQQQVPVTYGKTFPKRQIKTFLIHSLNLTKNKQASQSDNQRIKLEFLDRDHTAKISIEFTAEQLHKFIGEILKQVQNWDLINPWLADKNFFLAAGIKDNLLH